MNNDQNELLQLLQQEPRGSANRHGDRIQALIAALEQAQPADLSRPEALKQLEGVWELRWSSSSQPYLAVAPWLENLQCLCPSHGRAMNLLRPAGPLASLAAIAVEATIELQDPGAGAGAGGVGVGVAPAAEAQAGKGQPGQRVAVRFQRGGWLGPCLGGQRLQWLRQVSQSFPAWLGITVLDDELRLCRGNGGTVFALLRRKDLSLETLLLPAQ